MQQDLWPTEIKVSPDRAILSISFGEDRAYAFTAEYLRVMSPSAEVQGHSPEQRQLQSGKAWVTIDNVAPVGNYAVRVTFSDGHSTGLFTWAFFADHGPEMETRFAAYVAELEAKGLSR